MTIRDRGKLKWQPASFMPLAFEMHREMLQGPGAIGKAGIR
ncbi:hypothetical protein [Neobacillus sp. OS1-33]|nr:hypothetical protein [Neobacillus sp. OS1-33]WML24117.1 hypothetical protein RCG22_14240 [Neobacillus sp. OS1-33]